MPQLAAFILSLMLALSVGLGSVAHAMEAGNGMEVPASLSWSHSADDGDQAPPDADKGYPHHHVSCHGDHVAVPLALPAALTMSAVSNRPQPWDPCAATLATIDPALRPPQA